MGADLVGGILMAPGGIAIWAAFLLVCSFATYQGAGNNVPIGPLRLFLGYIGGIIACVVLSAASAYISASEAARVWHVPPAHYHKAIIQEFVTSMSVSTLTVTLGIAIIGVPVTFRLAHFGRAQIGWILLCSIAISLVFSLVFYLIEFFMAYSSSLSENVFLMTMYLTGSHLLVSFFFCIGSGLHWCKPTKVRH
jgi:hypothetical protein